MCSSFWLLKRQSPCAQTRDTCEWEVRTKHTEHIRRLHAEDEKCWFICFDKKLCKCVQLKFNAMKWDTLNLVYVRTFSSSSIAITKRSSLPYLISTYLFSLLLLFLFLSFRPSQFKPWFWNWNFLKTEISLKLYEEKRGRYAISSAYAI